MSKCLVTTLKDAVTDSSLLKLGEMKFSVNSTSVNRLTTRFIGSSATLTIIGNGHFTNQEGSANLGTSVTVSADTDDEKYLSPGSYDVVISNKYQLGKFFLLYPFTPTYWRPAQNAKIEADSFTGSKIYMVDIGANSLDGSLDELIDHINLPAAYLIAVSGETPNYTLSSTLERIADNTLLQTLNYGNLTKVTGDISTLTNKAGLLWLMLTNTGVSGNISAVARNNIVSVLLGGTKVTGNLSSLSGNSDMTQLDVSKTAVTGNLNSLSQCTALTSLNVSDTTIAGDTSALAGLTHLTNFYYASCPNITGTWPLV